MQHLQMKLPASPKILLSFTLRLLASAPCLLTMAVIVPETNAASVVKVAAGYLYLTDDSTLWSWEQNAPVQEAASVVTMAAGSGGHTLFIKNDSTLWGMGYNLYGELGNGTTTDQDTPVQIATSVIAVAAGFSHSLFVKSDGTLWAMGDNVYGELGDGTTTEQRYPVQVATDVIAVAAGNQYSLFIKSDGTLWGMGANFSGQLGDGTTTSQNFPKQVAANVIAVAAGNNHSLFVKNDGTLWAMGDNFFGQLGDGTNTSRSTPVQVAVNVLAATAGNMHSLFIKTDNTLWAMGDNAYGELGDGTVTSRNHPVQVAADVIAAAAGEQSSLFIKNDGTLWLMGLYFSENRFKYQSAPMYAAGGSVPAFIAQPVNQSVATGQTATFVIATSGTPTPTLQWQFSLDGHAWTPLYNGVIYYNGVNYDAVNHNGATTASLTITTTTATLNGSQYRCVATNIISTATSNPATLTVFAMQLASQVVSAGATAVFTITDIENSALAYQWQSAPLGSGNTWADISGATTNTLAVADTTTGMNGTQYRCVVTDSVGSVTSNAATLHVTPDAATATAQQLKIQLEASGTATVAVTGTSDLSLVGGAILTSGKTIVGADANTTIVNGLTIPAGVNNTVILGVNFISGTLNIAGATDVTITNCTFTDTPVNITGGADNIALAWNKFTATPAGAAGNGSAMRIDSTGTIGILLQDNLWADGLLSNMPAATNARVLMFNNYITATGNDTATIAGAGAQILSANNIYQGTHNPFLTQDGGLLRARDNFMTATTGTTATGDDTVFVPIYSYIMLPTDNVISDATSLADLITACAGNTDGQNSVTPSPTTSISARISRDKTITYPPGTLVTRITVFDPYWREPVEIGLDAAYGSKFTLTSNPSNSLILDPIPITRQWYRDNFAISGATGVTYTVTNATTADAGVYSVTLTGTDNEIVTSAAYTVTVSGSSENNDSANNSGGNNSGNSSSNSGGGGGGAPSLLWLGAAAALAALRRAKGGRPF